MFPYTGFDLEHEPPLSLSTSRRERTRFLAVLSRQPQCDVVEIVGVLITPDDRELHAAEKVRQLPRVHVIGLQRAEIEVQIGKHR